jgi:hypothetical protein
LLVGFKSSVLISHREKNVYTCTKLRRLSNTIQLFQKRLRNVLLPLASCLLPLASCLPRPKCSIGDCECNRRKVCMCNRNFKNIFSSVLTLATCTYDPQYIFVLLCKMQHARCNKTFSNLFEIAVYDGSYYIQTIITMMYRIV